MWIKLVRTPLARSEKGVRKKSIRASVYFLFKIEDFKQKIHARPKKVL